MHVVTRFDTQNDKLLAAVGHFRICNGSVDCNPRQNHKAFIPFLSSVCRLTVVNGILAGHNSTSRTAVTLKVLMGTYPFTIAHVPQGNQYSAHHNGKGLEICMFS